MNALGPVLRMKRQELRNRFLTLGTHSKLKIGVVLASALSFWTGLYVLFFQAFKFLGRYPEMIDSMMAYLLALFFFCLNLMLVFSNGIIGYHSFFASEETSFLMTRPIRQESIYLYKLSEGLLFSSWAFVFLGTPLLVAYGQTQHVPWIFYPGMLVFLGLFMFIPASLGSAAAVAIAAFYPQRRRALVWTLLGAVVLGGLLIGARVLRLNVMVRAFDTIWVQEVLDSISFTRSPWLPSYWVSEGVIALGRRSWENVVFYLGLVLANSLFVSLVGYHFAAWKYRDAWSRVQGHPLRRRVLLGRALAWAIRGVLRPVSRRLGIMVAKDVMIFLRDPVQWSQFLIFFGLLGVYFLNLRKVTVDLQAEMWKNTISFLNMSATGLTLATFTSRFVFPQLSLEGRRFWVVGMVPMRRGTLLVGKFVYAFMGSLMVSQVLVTLSSWRLKVSLEIGAVNAITGVAVCLGLSGMAVGLGACYPNFREDNPSKIVSGFGGTLNLVLSLCFVAAVTFALAIPCHYYLVMGELSPAGFRFAIRAALGVVIALSLATAGVPMYVGWKRFQRMEF